MKLTKDYKNATEAIKAAQSIAIAGHINPDGDSIGSGLALMFALRAKNKKAYFLSPDTLPKRYGFLPGAKKIKRKLNEKIDLGISIDCASKKQLGEAYNTLRQAKKLLEIDHHFIRRQFGDIQLVDINAASVGEIIFKLLGPLRVSLSKEIATNILVSIIVETHSFRLPNVTPFTFDVCAHILKKQRIDFYEVINKLFWVSPRRIFSFLSFCLSKTHFLNEGKLAWLLITKKDFMRFGTKDEDADTIADELRTIKTVKIVIVFRQKSKDELRVSLRSKYNINIAELAEAFGGAGHLDSAGCKIKNSITVMQDIINEAKRFLR